MPNLQLNLSVAKHDAKALHEILVAPSSIQNDKSPISITKAFWEAARWQNEMAFQMLADYVKQDQEKYGNGLLKIGAVAYDALMTDKYAIALAENEYFFKKQYMTTRYCLDENIIAALQKAKVEIQNIEAKLQDPHDMGRHVAPKREDVKKIMDIASKEVLKYVGEKTKVATIKAIKEAIDMNQTRVIDSCIEYAIKKIEESNQEIEQERLAVMQSLGRMTQDIWLNSDNPLALQRYLATAWLDQNFITIFGVKTTLDGHTEIDSKFYRTYDDKPEQVSVFDYFFIFRCKINRINKDLTPIFAGRYEETTFHYGRDGIAPDLFAKMEKYLELQPVDLDKIKEYSDGNRVNQEIVRNLDRVLFDSDYNIGPHHKVPGQSMAEVITRLVKYAKNNAILDDFDIFDLRRRAEIFEHKEVVQVLREIDRLLSNEEAPIQKMMQMLQEGGNNSTTRAGIYQYLQKAYKTTERPIDITNDVMAQIGLAAKEVNYQKMEAGNKCAANMCQLVAYFPDLLSCDLNQVFTVFTTKNMKININAAFSFASNWGYVINNNPEYQKAIEGKVTPAVMDAFIESIERCGCGDIAEDKNQMQKRYSLGLFIEYKKERNKVQKEIGKRPGTK